jgi:hypothetical protein
VVVEPRCPRRRPYAAVRQRRDEPVQARIPRHGGAGVVARPATPRLQHLEVHPRRREAQRSGRRGERYVPPHLL